MFFSQIFQFFGRKPVDFRENLVLYREGTSPGISASTTSTSWRTRRRGLEVPQNGRSWEITTMDGSLLFQGNPGIPTTIKTMGVNITTIDYLRVFIIEIGSTIILMVVEAQG